MLNLFAVYLKLMHFFYAWKWWTITFEGTPFSDAYTHNTHTHKRVSPCFLYLWIIVLIMVSREGSALEICESLGSWESRQQNWGCCPQFIQPHASRNSGMVKHNSPQCFCQFPWLDFSSRSSEFFVHFFGGPRTAGCTIAQPLFDLVRSLRVWAGRIGHHVEM